MDELQIGSYRWIVFDVDGTLYNQWPVRLCMASELLRECVKSKGFWKELLALYQYRKMREALAGRPAPMNVLCREIGNQYHIAPADVDVLIQTWMFERPLKYIQRFAYKEIISFLKSFQEQSGTIIAYSDYAVVEKLQALGIRPDAAFYPVGTSDDLKPSKRPMKKIMDATKLVPKETLYIGDSVGKDGYVAKCFHITFLHVKELLGHGKIYSNHAP